MPGFEGVAVYDTVSFFLREIKRDSVNVRAASVAFNFLLATFPGIIFLFTMIAYIPIDGFTTTLLHSIKSVMPDTTYNATHDTIEDIIHRHRGGLLSIGLVFALYYSTSGVRSLMTAFNKNHPNFRRRSFANRYWISFKITVLLMVTLLVTVAFIVLGKYLVHVFVNLDHARWKTMHYMLNAVNWVFITILLYVSASLIYYYGPASKIQWRFWSIGSTVATTLTILTSVAFSLFVGYFVRYNTVYGSIGTLMVIMLWYYFNAYSLLIGFELNASIDYNKHVKGTKG